jgi:hypothetical protein
MFVLAGPPPSFFLDGRIDWIWGIFEIVLVRQRIYFFERADQTRGVAVSSRLVHSCHADLNTALLWHLHVGRGGVFDALMDVVIVLIIA